MALTARVKREGLSTKQKAKGNASIFHKGLKNVRKKAAGEDTKHFSDEANKYIAGSTVKNPGNLLGKIKRLRSRGIEKSIKNTKRAYTNPSRHQVKLNNKGK